MKYEFGSPEWFAALHAILCERAAIAARENPGFRQSTCEVFTDPPKRLLPPGAQKLAWHCRIEGAKVEFARTEIDDADTKIVGDYDTLLPFSHFVVNGDPAREKELERLLAEAVAAGKVHVVRRAQGSGAMGSVHDAICLLTA